MTIPNNKIINEYHIDDWVLAKTDLRIEINETAAIAIIIMP